MNTNQTDECPLGDGVEQNETSSHEAPESKAFRFHCAPPWPRNNQHMLSSAMNPFRAGQSSLGRLAELSRIEKTRELIRYYKALRVFRFVSCYSQQETELLIPSYPEGGFL
jgi:hypothetical protein